MIEARKSPAQCAPEPVTLPITVCLLCYGDHPDLATRVLGSLARFAPPAAIRLRLGLNAVSAETERVVEKLLPGLPVDYVVRSATNIYKAPMMRRLFFDRPLMTSWTAWFDDDSFVHRSDWLEMLCCESRLNPQIDMWGQPLLTHGDEAQREFIEGASWHCGRALEAGDRPGQHRLRFIAGGYWVIRTEFIHRLNWPDSRLIHFGDDYMLGEALRQNGGRIGSAISGISINCASRRAPTDAPRCAVLR